jgi:general secretion pathway protein L
MAVDLYRWWISELWALVPETLRLGHYLRPDLTLVFDSDTATLVSGKGSGAREIASIPFARLSGTGQIELAAISKGKRWRQSKAVAALPEWQVFLTRIDLPLAAEQTLRQVLGHEVERLVPLARSEVYFTYRLLERRPDRNRLTAEIAVAKKATIDRVLLAARSLRLELAEIGIVGDLARPPLDFARVIEGATGLHRSRRRLPWLLDIVAASLLIVALGLRFHQLHGLQDHLSGEISAAKTGADAAADIERKLQLLTERQDFLTKRVSSPAVVKVLAEATKLLPDDTWVFEFDLSNREIRMHGYARQASDLVALIDSSPLFTNARFRSPTTAAATDNSERFDLSFDLKGSDKP